MSDPLMRIYGEILQDRMKAMSTPIYEQMVAEREAEEMEDRVPWLDQSCEACVLMYKGWGGPGCCDVCDMMGNPEHSCAPEDRP
jgi:hypothetical protein